ncbi:MAG TPA: GH3 auxin-responsive promoter family protein [Alphaproteobacteria bacterium]
MLDVTPPFRLYAARRRRALEGLDAAAIQQATLRRLVKAAEQTRFGRDHGFADIGSVAEFQARVPLRDYDRFWDEYWQAPFPRLVDCTWPGTMPYFAVSSGTTRGVTKYIPCSHAMNRSNRRAAVDLLVHHVANRPHSRILGGRSFMLGGSTALIEQAPGIYSGDLSGIAAKVMPRWARLRYFPPRELETIADWERKIECLARRSLREDIRALSGAPSWLLLFLDRLAAIEGLDEARIAALYPRLELLVHGGVSFVPYRDRFALLLAGSGAETREVYPASEGFFAIADRGDGEGLRLTLDIGLFYEFVPVDELESDAPSRRWIADVEPGVNYALVVSTCAGLWAYVVGDTVRFVDLDPPRVLVTGRTAYTLSAFGEHLIGEELETAVAEAAGEIGAEVVDFSAGSLFPRARGERGGHLYVVEFAAAIDDAARLAGFAAKLDAVLMRLNVDYKDHRAEGFGLNPPRVHPVPPGTFAAWMRRRGKLGGQHKVPRVINDQALFEDLRRFAGDLGAAEET